jgi:hypothetical protein
LDITEKSGLDFSIINKAADVLVNHKLLEEISEEG